MLMRVHHNVCALIYNVRTDGLTQVAVNVNLRHEQTASLNAVHIKYMEHKVQALNFIQ